EEDLETIDPKDYPELYPEEDYIETTEEEEDLSNTEWFVDTGFEEEQDPNFVPLWQRTAFNGHMQDRMAIQQVSRELMASGHLTAAILEDILKENKVENVCCLDIRDKCDWTDYMLIADSPKGDKFLSSVADHVGQVVRKTIQSHPTTLSNVPDPRIEGRDGQSGWILIDLGRFVIHLFTPEKRQAYDIEGLWKSV
ncbi:Oligomerization domain-containing protein, partial [Spinellus fusiger]